MSVALPLSGTWRRVMRRRFEVAPSLVATAQAADRRAEFIAQMAGRAQEAATMAQREARAAKMRAGKEFRFAALSNDGGLGTTFALERPEAARPSDPGAIAMAAIRADEEARWRLCDRARMEADEAIRRAEAATATARIAQQAADEALEAARAARMRVVDREGSGARNLMTAGGSLPSPSGVFFEAVSTEGTRAA